MAIALRGAAWVPAGNPTTSFTCTIDSSVATDDYLIMMVTSRDSTSGSSNVTCTDDDSGGNTWTTLHNSADKKVWIFGKRATSGTASKTITIANCVGSSSGVGKAFSGVSTGTIPTANIVEESNASGNETHAGFTPSYQDCMLLAGIFNYANDNAVTSLSFATAGATTMTESLSTGGSDCATAFGHVLQSGNPAATGSLTWSQTNGTTYSVTLVLVPDVINLLRDFIEYWPHNESSGTRTGLHGARSLTEVGGVTSSATGLVYSLAADFERDNSRSLTCVSDSGLQTGNIDFAVMAAIKLESNIGAGGLFEVCSKRHQSNFSATEFEWSLFIGESGGSNIPVLGIYNAGAGTQVLGDAITTGNWVIIVAWHDAFSDTINIQINNATPDSAAAASGAPSTTQPWWVGGRTGSTAFFDGLIGPVAFWKRILNEAERTTLYNSGNGLAYTGFGVYISVPIGSITITGQDPSLALPIAVPAGSITVTGLAPTPLPALSISIPAGSITVTGLAPTLAITIAIPAGEIAVTGLAPTLLPALSISVPVGSATITGLAPALLNGIAVPAGSIAIEGLAPTSLPALSISVPAGSITITGLAPTSTESGAVSIAVPAGSITLEGLAPVLSGTATISVPAGSITVDGLAPTVLNTLTISVPAGSVTVTGLSPSLNSGIAVPAGSITVTGLAPLAFSGIFVATPVGSVTISGLAPALRGTIGVPVGSITMSGLTPTINVRAKNREIGFAL